MYSRKKIKGLILKWDGSRFRNLKNEIVHLSFKLPDMPLYCILGNNKLYVVDLITPFPLEFEKRLQILQKNRKLFKKGIEMVNYSSPPLVEEPIRMNREQYTLEWEDLEENLMEVSVIKLINMGNYLKGYKCLTPSGKQIQVRHINREYIFKDGECLFIPLGEPKEGSRITIEYDKLVNNYPQKPKYKC